MAVTILVHDVLSPALYLPVTLCLLRAYTSFTLALRRLCASFGHVVYACFTLLLLCLRSGLEHAQGTGRG
jgi:hypothetical protein